MYLEGVYMHIGPRKKMASLINTLRFFALNKEGNVKDLANSIKKDYSTAARIIRRTKNRGIIALHHTESTSVKGKDRKIYRITLRGLFTYMIFDRDFALQNFDAITEAHQDRLLTFRKWAYFKSKSLEAFVKESFFESLEHYSVGEFLLFYVTSKIKGEPAIPKRAETANTVKAADADILNIFVMLEPPGHIQSIYVAKWGESKWNDLIKLFKAIDEDYELRMFKDEMVFKLRKQREEQLKALDEWMEVLAQAIQRGE